MKWSVFGLLIAGLLAAVCATVLVASIQAKSKTAFQLSSLQADVGDGLFLKAAEDIEENQWILPEMVEDAKPEAPRTDYIKDRDLVIGSMSARAIKKDEFFTAKSIRNEGRKIPTILPPGMEAVTLSLTDSQSMYGILRPGYMVDVLATLTVGARKEAVGIRLLDDVRVLAVEGETIDQAQAEGKKNQVTRKILVTLMVTARQAVALSLAGQYGSVSLSLNSSRPKKDAEYGAASVNPEVKLADLVKTVDLEAEKRPASPPPATSVVPETGTRTVIVIRGDGMSTVKVPD